ncbi:hypothetical protein FJ950_10390 [Mesorhizobium sp. B2-3-14]|uniref:hypothetical protein n=1 Tax=Mesorhizobium sp. B2-3-14 TaxID=2589950 RepID=UPI0011286478|nr:hypothetical protein [Mesorhizobium sp. B2-3-14]TPL86801.1 hypothetical protein FJ950_10390 [Mesorhizobium sp. B2-3-14]
MARKNHINGLFARVSEADFRKHFKSMSPLALHAYLALELAYWKTDGTNPMEISKVWLAEATGCGQRTAPKLIAELREAGFLQVVRQGKLSGGPRSSRGSWYRLGWLEEKSNGAKSAPLTVQISHHERGKIYTVENPLNQGPGGASNFIDAKALRHPAHLRF